MRAAKQQHAVRHFGADAVQCQKFFARLLIFHAAKRVQFKPIRHAPGRVLQNFRAISATHLRRTFRLRRARAPPAWESRAWVRHRFPSAGPARMPSTQLANAHGVVVRRKDKRHQRFPYGLAQHAQAWQCVHPALQGRKLRIAPRNRSIIAIPIEIRPILRDFSRSHEHGLTRHNCGISVRGFAPMKALRAIHQRKLWIQLLFFHRFCGAAPSRRHSFKNGPA